MTNAQERILWELETGALDAPAAIRQLVAAGVSKPFAEEAAFLTLGGSGTLERSAEGAYFYPDTGKTEAEVDALMRGSK